jgi:D-beta-D-heptose 7-phosphate kinase/D-beta-D-heptose 1-phosphate adenosyltransferase
MVLSRFNCDPDKIANAVLRFKGRRILVLGDLMLDRFIWGTVHRISPEAPVPVVEIRRETTCLGGAANVAANIRSLGGRPVPIGLVGKDREGEELQKEFKSLGAPLSGLIVDRTRPTSVKTRIIAHHQQVCRADREDRSPLSPETQDRVTCHFLKTLPRVDSVVVSDYAKGLVSLPLLRAVLPAAARAGKVVCVDPKMQDLAAYRPATVITPNTQEAERAAGRPIGSTEEVVCAGRKILRETGIQHLLITRGEEGMALFEDHGRVTHIPTLAREVYDVTGAGDTVISTLALGLSVGLSILEAAVLSNIAAGIVVGKLGTASVSPEELISRIRAR